MKRDSSRRWQRSGLLLVALLFFVPSTGCSVFVDEFTWLNRPPPKAFDPASGVSGP